MRQLFVVCALFACDADKKPAALAAAEDPWNVSTGTPRAPKPTAGDPLVGLWGGVEFKPGLHYSMTSDTFSQETQLGVAWAVILPGGKMIHGAPTAGLADFDHAAWASGVERDASLGGVAGTYTWSGAAGKATLSTGFEEDMALSDDGELRLGKAKLHRMPDVTGVRLDGAYTRYTNTADPYLDGPGCKQLITLRADGTFDDRGAFVIACPPAPTDPNVPGQGTYEIRDFSLILSYRDGRTLKRRIAPALNQRLETSSPHFFLGNDLMNRR